MADDVDKPQDYTIDKAEADINALAEALVELKARFDRHEHGQSGGLVYRE